MSSYADSPSLQIDEFNFDPVNDVICLVSLKDKIQVTWQDDWIVASFTDEELSKSIYEKYNVNTDDIYKVLGLELSVHDKSVDLPPSVTLQFQPGLNGGTLVIDGSYFEIYNCKPLNSFTQQLFYKN
ncbi:MAG: hypothetical protein KDD40_01485 [Bdellovibrionales bacterium]|nr:hypothetical protein [Bdellovibrionales bacterium]